MSFAYLAFYTGDYLRDTRHLTPLKHGVYMLALMYCWDSRGPMPLDEQECSGICNCRSADEVEALRYVLGRFFVKMPDGHYNKRMAEEIERACILSDKRSGAAHDRWKARESIKAMQKHASALQVQSKSKATAPPLPPPSPQEEKYTVATPLVAEGDAKRPPPCQFDQLLALYHKHCPSLPAVRVMTNMRQKHARARWIQVYVDNDYTTAEQIIEFFTGYFKMAEASKFLTGKSTTAKRAWKADYEWLMTAGNFAKAVEGKYQEENA
jgi:uncharacterized protein YdaU (DUF1376 family)